MFSNGRKVARVVSTIVAVLVIFSVPMVAGAAVNSVTSNANQTSGLPANITKDLQLQLEKYLDGRAKLAHWNVSKENITLVSTKRLGTEVSAVFDVKTIARDNWTKVEDSPAIKGRVAFLRDKSTQLSRAQIAEINKDMAIWKQALTEYVTKDQETNDRIKVVGLLDSKGMLMVDTVKLYLEGPLGGDYQQISLDQIPTTQEAEKGAYNAVSKLAEDVKRQKQVTSAATYNPSSAVSYANTWVKATSSHCSDGYTYQNHYNYNLSQYSTWYDCNDCANYVSQAVNAGGIPRHYVSGGWYPYTACWINCNYLVGYMVLNDNWHSTDINGCSAGYPFVMYHTRTDGSRDYYHALMMVYNNGAYRKFSAHTNDRNQSSWSGTSGVQFFRVGSTVY